ncbi:PREDICTED: uncharacterized protein LOC107172435 [Diuraphis noxia]|uniref:uncharacterized protein LOC107172435 n=1 Tax=Diuraphis noxia TaxID=143948 RepID=UPI0007636DFD|nr:PREDICTED: uncharacterized protein LOC107172435 [Diuraphis noxia]
MGYRFATPGGISVLPRGRLLLNRLEEIQYLYFNGRPEWTTIQKNDLKLFLAYVFYDSPFLNNAIAEKNYRHDNNSDEIFKLYKTENQKDILKMNDFIDEKYIKPDIFNSIKLGLTIIHRICKNKCDGCQNFPDKDIHLLKLIRFKLNNKCIFIDFENHRTYTGWDEFIEKNNLPEGFIFYPESGIYDASKKLSQNITPASYKTEKILKTIENISGIFNWASGLILITGSLIFPLAAPIIYISATVVTGASSFKAYRQIVNLRDMYKYENNVSCTKATSKWIELTISAIGVLVAPCYAFSAITSEINSSIQSTRKALTVFRNGACITQCALEIVRVTLDFINDGFKITSENVLKLRLDLFVAMGLLMPSNYIVNILKVRINQCSINVIYIFK